MARRLTQPQRDRLAAERMAGRKERMVASAHHVSRRTVRNAIAQVRDAMPPEDYAASAAELRARLLASIDDWLSLAMADLAQRDTAGLKPPELARLMSDVARVRRDVAAAPVPGTGETPAERLARQPAPVMPVFSAQEWAARHPSPAPAQ